MHIDRVSRSALPLDFSTLETDEIDALLVYLDRIEAAAQACDLPFDDNDTTHDADPNQKD